MKTGIGYANIADARLSGMKVAETAMANGNIQNPDLVLAFCHGNLNHNDFFNGLKSIVGEGVPIIGGSAVGIITNEHLSYDGHPAGAVILSSSDVSLKWASADDLDTNEENAGRSLGKKIASSENDRLFLIFYDSIKTPQTETTPPIMNASPPIIKGIEATLRTNAPIIGAGVTGDFNFGPTQQFCGDRVGGQKIVGLMMSGDVSVYHCVMHGCTLHDGLYHTITRIEGANIFELDGLPIVPIIDEMYDSREWQTQTPLKRLAIGLNQGELFGPFKEENYVNRLITGLLPNKEGIVIFEPDLEVGSLIQFMLRDSEEMILSARKNTSDLMARIHADGKHPLFGLYIDCAGRTAAVSETLTEEASEVVTIMNRHHTPLLGFYSGVEVAPMRGRSRGLDWTAVLTVLAQ